MLANQTNRPVWFVGMRQEEEDGGFVLELSPLRTPIGSPLYSHRIPVVSPLLPRWVPLVFSCDTRCVPALLPLHPPIGSPLGTSPLDFHWGPPTSVALGSHTSNVHPGFHPPMPPHAPLFPLSPIHATFSSFHLNSSAFSSTICTCNPKFLAFP